MQELQKEELLMAVQAHRQAGREEKLLDMQDRVLRDMDLSGANLRRIDFSRSSFYNVVLDEADLSGSILNNTWFEGCTLRRTVLRDADLTSGAFRGIDMSGCNIRGANLFCAVLEKADLKGCIADENTRFFRLYCPESGPFIGYKKCCDNRIVELLIPADAKRTSATRNSCRCSKAKVLVIKSFDCSQYYQEAWSTVDENFVYRTGEWVEVSDFDEDRWNDSTTGIHFWMTREDAIQY